MMTIIHAVIQVADYLACDWKGTLEITRDMEEFKAIIMDTDVDPDNNNKHLSLSVHFNLTETCNLYIYSPYWIVNKTDLTFQIRVSRLLLWKPMLAPTKIILVSVYSLTWLRPGPKSMKLFHAQLKWAWNLNCSQKAK